MSQLKCLNLLLCCLCTLAAGCSSSSQPERDKAQLAQTDAEGAASNLSEEQALEFGKQLEAAIVARDMNKATQLIPFELMADRIVSGAGATGEMAEQLKAGMMNGRPVATLMTQVVDSLGDNGQYKLLRVMSRGGQMHAVFRLLTSDGGLNYHLFRLIPSGGKAVADELYVAMSGEAVTETMIEACRPAVASAQSAVGRLTGESKKKVDELLKCKQMTIALQSGRTQEALNIIESLAPETRKMKNVQLARLGALADGDETIYLQALEDYAKMFPGDPSLALISLDRAVLKEDADRLLGCFKNLTDWTGGDNYLATMTASLLSMWGKEAKAREIYDNLEIPRESSADTHDFYMTAALHLKDYDVVLQELRILRDDFDYEFQDLSQFELYTDFAKSSQYQQWLSD